MPELELPTARLVYDVVGKGPLLLCISGANGDSPIWRFFADHLKDHFTVCSYDRRGFSRSSLTGAQDYEHRLEGDADDAAALIKHLSPKEPAIVIGNSSGAIVSLQLLLRHPDCIRCLIPHEPPLMRVCPNWPELKAKTEAAHATYRREGPHSALVEFSELVRMGSERDLLLRGLDTRQTSKSFSNIQYWFEREFLVYPFQEWSVGSMLEHREKIMLANGDESPKDALQYQANETLARDLGLELVLLAGGHVGFISHSVKFAEGFLEAMKKRGLV